MRKLLFVAFLAFLIGDTAYSSAVQAVIDIDGTLAFHHPESVEGAVAAQWLGGAYEQKPEIWAEAAPPEEVPRRRFQVLRSLD